jgi:hypothetical protein
MKNERLRSGKDQGSPALTSDKKTTAAVARLSMVATIPVTSGEGEGEDEMQEGTAKSMACRICQLLSGLTENGRRRSSEVDGGSDVVFDVSSLRERTRRKAEEKHTR